MLSIIIPAYNEARNITRTLSLLDGFLKKTNREYEIILVSDGSTDNTVAVAQELKLSKLQVFSYGNNRGKGYAMKYGFSKSSGDTIVFFDAGADFNPDHIQIFQDILNKESADFVIGSKRHPDSLINYPVHRRALSFAYHVFTLVLFNLNIKDTQAGFKLIKRRVLAKCLPHTSTNSFAFDLELLVTAKKLGFRIIEAPVSLDFNKTKTSITPMFIWRTFIDTIKIFIRNGKLKISNLFWLVLAALIIRVLFFSFADLSGLFFGGDAPYYLGLRDRVMAGDFLISDIVAGSRAFVAPLYPWFLAFVGTIFGSEITWIYLIQVAIGLGNILIVYRISSRFFLSKYILVAPAFYIAYFPILANEFTVNFVLLLQSFILLATLFLFQGVRSKKYSGFAWSGLVFGLASLTHSAVLYFPFVVFFSLLFFDYSQWKKYFLFMFVFLLTLGPWFARNAYVNARRAVEGSPAKTMLINQGQELEIFSIVKSQFAANGSDIIKDKLSALVEAFAYPHRFSYIYAYKGETPENHFNEAVSDRSLRSLAAFLGQPKAFFTLLLFLSHFALISLFAVAVWKNRGSLRLKNKTSFYKTYALLFIAYLAVGSVLLIPSACAICYSYYLVPALPFIIILSTDVFGIKVKN